jgi:hypothetical protein
MKYIEEIIKMKIYSRAFDAALGQIKQVETEMSVTFRSAVATISDLPTSDNAQGDARMAVDSDHLYVYVSGEWLDQGVYDVQDLLQERLMQSLS